MIKLKCLLYADSTSNVGYWREVVFGLTFFGLATCSVIFVYQVCQWHMHMQNTWFNLWWVFSMDDITSAQRWFPHAGAWLSLTRQPSLYRPEVIAPAVTAKTLTLTWGEAYLLRISSPPTNHLKPSSSMCATFWHCPKYNFMLWFSCVLLFLI